jgi:hypothetical protein
MQHTHETDSSRSPQSIGWRRALPWVAGIVLGVVVAGACTQMPAVSQATIRLTAVHPGGEVIGSPIDADVVLSSNGTHIVYVAGSGGATVGRLHARALDELEPTLLAESARSPFLSPDDQWVGFMSGDEGTWMKVPITGGLAGAREARPGDRMTRSSFRRSKSLRVCSGYPRLEGERPKS